MVRPVRICFAITHFWPLGFGAEGMTYRLARELGRRGHAVTVLTQRLDGVPAREERDGFEICRELRTLNLKLVGGFRYLMSGRRFLRRRRFDVVQAQAFYLDAYAATFCDSRLVVRMMCQRPYGDLAVLERAPWGGRVIRRVVERADRFVVMSGALRDELAGLGVEPARIATIPNGVDVERFDLPMGSDVLFVGRLTHQKGADTLLRAWTRAPQGRLVLVGDGPQEAELRAMGAPDVLFTGRVDDVRPYLERAGVFVLPSRAEGMSNALLEAMAAGRACIASDIGPNRELIEHERHGLLVPPDDEAALSAALARLASPELRERLGRAARERVRAEFSLDRVVGLYAELYDSLR